MSQESQIKLSLNEKTKRQAAEIMNNVIQRETLSAGKDPMGLAASVPVLSIFEYRREYNSG